MKREVREENLVGLVPLVGTDALRLQAIARALHKLAEAKCSYALTEWQLRKGNRLTEEAEGIATEHGLQVYYQADPRGWPLYLLTPEQVEEWDIGAIYDRGVAVCPH